MPNKDFFDKLEEFPIACINAAIYLIPLGIITLGIIWVIADNTRYNNNTKRLVKEMPQSSRDKVFNAGDSILNSRIARYDSLIQDYNLSVNEMRNSTGILSFRSAEFDKHYVEPEFANQIGVKNLKQYKRYIQKFETDSIEPRMRYVYNNSVKNHNIRSNLQNTR